jgi:hypothetical protein
MSTASNQQAATVQSNESDSIVLDFDSDEPLAVCPMRKDGMGPDETCEACQ